MFAVTRTFTFCAAHRLLNHPGRCRWLHGHNYTVEVTISAANLNDQNMVVDFGEMKDKLGTWIDANFDHNTILNREDPLAQFLQFQENNKGKEPLIIGNDPTAEIIAGLIKAHADSIFNRPGMKVEHVIVHETGNCRAFAL